MITIDKLLSDLLTQYPDYVEIAVGKKDFETMKGLHTAIVSPGFITENQGNLVIKLLQENRKKLLQMAEEIGQVLAAGQWSRSFRQVEQIKKMYISKNHENDVSMIIEFSYNSAIRKILTELSKTVEGLAAGIAGKIYTADLTEKNIVALVESLEPMGFEIEDTIITHYKTIKSWSEIDVCNQFLISNIENANFQKHITADLGIATAIDQNIISDRSMRYQYNTENVKNHGETLTEIISNRAKTKVWVDKAQHSLTEIIASIIELRRLPMLVVFDATDETKTHEHLVKLSEALEENEIFEGVGVYFRLPNNEQGKKFNQLIATKNYNHKLDDTAIIATVQSGKIPKFFLKNEWKPMSVISLDSRMGLRHGKTSVYANCCDLIIEWADQPTLLERRIV